MAKEKLPLREVSIEELYMNSDQIKYEIPIYQRNYAWEKEEITALIQDIYDAYKKDSVKCYYVGTLVSFYRGDQVYEVIDGQQRMTTIRILLAVLGIVPKTQLTYKARKKSDETLKHMPDFEKIDAVIGSDSGIIQGFRYAKEAYDAIIPENEKQGFLGYFKEKVHLIHYQVPKDIDLNHYFEIMNSRGEQLEKYEIVKANLMEELDRSAASERELELFNRIWECCSEMNVYIQQNLNDRQIFGDTYSEFCLQSYEEIETARDKNTKNEDDRQKKNSGNKNRLSLEEIIRLAPEDWASGEEDYKKDSFQPIIDFSNFLLIVLKITRMEEPDFAPAEFNLDDKELLREFDAAKIDPRKFCFCLLKARYFLDNFIVHHAKEEDTLENNPWKLQKWAKEEKGAKGYLKGYPRNLSDNAEIQEKLVHLLSMFEVSFTARQRKNYLFYCLLYLMRAKTPDLDAYADFVENLAARYFHQVYLNPELLNAINVPAPGAFDATILKGHGFDVSPVQKRTKEEFCTVFGNGETASDGIPLFVFNYLDYLIWEKYAKELRGEKTRATSAKRKAFFEELGCSSFELNVFEQFYFSRTRRSLEHYFPQAAADGQNGNPDQNQINCFGNYAMIGSQANSSGSNWSPKTKLDHYLDPSGKISQISVASLKFMIMMQMCRDEEKWDFEEIQKHQEKMLEVLCDA